MVILLLTRGLARFSSSPKASVAWPNPHCSRTPCPGNASSHFMLSSLSTFLFLILAHCSSTCFIVIHRRPSRFVRCASVPRSASPSDVLNACLPSILRYLPHGREAALRCAETRNTSNSPRLNRPIQPFPPFPTALYLTEAIYNENPWVLFLANRRTMGRLACCASFGGH